jgi:hypothetical protein
MRSRKIFHPDESPSLIDASKTQITESKCKLDSQLVESLGFTSYFLSEVSSEFASFDELQRMDLAQMARDIGMLSAKLNILCSVYDKRISVERIKAARRREQQWAEVIAHERSERLNKEIEKARTKQAKSLKGLDRRLYKETGKLPQEYKKSIMDEFARFLESHK